MTNFKSRIDKIEDALETTEEDSLKLQSIKDPKFREFVASVARAGGIEVILKEIRDEAKAGKKRTDQE